MKKEYVERKVVAEVYVADDGTTFSSKEECEKYEKTAAAVINARFCDTFKYDYQKGSGVWASDLCLCALGSEDEVVTFEPKNQDELNTLNMFMQNHGFNSEYIGIEYIGQKLVFSSYDGEYWFAGSESEVRAQLECNMKRILNNHMPKCLDCKYCNDNHNCTHPKAYHSKPNAQGKLTELTDCYKACYRFEEKD